MLASKFQEGTVSAEYNGQTFTFKFPYRDPWEVYQSWITDPTLSQEINWYPIRKYLCEDGKEVAIYDDINTGTLWWDIQVHPLDHFESLHLIKLSPIIMIRTPCQMYMGYRIVSSLQFFGSTKA